MIKIMFVCHGNICRSPMAEFVFRDLVNKNGISENFHIASSATSTEAIGCAVHRGTREKLKQFGISTDGKFAVRLTKNDYNEFDYIIAMDSLNIRNIKLLIGPDKKHKVSRLLDFAGGGDISDPWYTGDFDKTYDDVLRGCIALLDTILNKK